MNKYSEASSKLIILLISFCFTGIGVFASDNVLQAIQINGVKDSYNIILRSDDIAELKKTVQAPNKMILDLKGIRASKTINTIYNNTSSVDSVVVEPTGEDSVKVLVQADNVSNAQIHFDTLKTPLGVLDNLQPQTKAADEIVLSDPVQTYTPIYKDNADEEEEGLASSAAGYLKRALKSDKLNLLLTLGLFGIFVLSGIKLIKGNDNEIKVGLTQSLKDREIELYRGMGVDALSNPGQNPALNNRTGLNVELSNGYSAPVTANLAGNNYGVKAYQQSTRSPYLTSEIQRPRPAVSPAPSVANLQQAVKAMSLKPTAQATIPNNMQRASAPRQKTSNIDSMKFLESMTKIYEKNGRADLAQGLKTNMKKAKQNLM